MSTALMFLQVATSSFGDLVCFTHNLVSTYCHFQLAISSILVDFWLSNVL